MVVGEASQAEVEFLVVVEAEVASEVLEAVALAVVVQVVSGSGKS
jgi:hypothetical protein